MPDLSLRYSEVKKKSTVELPVAARPHVDSIWQARIEGYISRVPSLEQTQPYSLASANLTSDHYKQPVNNEKMKYHDFGKST